jgi:hypothetical protein
MLHEVRLLPRPDYAGAGGTGAALVLHDSGDGGLVGPHAGTWPAKPKEVGTEGHR